MKHAFLSIILLVISLSAGAQTAIYKHFAAQRGVHAYCVERYPLHEGDTVCVTLLTTADSIVYQRLQRELHSMKFSTRTPKLLNPDDYSPSKKHGYPAMKQKNQSKKSIEIRTADALHGDQGWYVICSPSDRMAFLIFLVHHDKEELSVIRHVTFSEFQ